MGNFDLADFEGPVTDLFSGEQREMVSNEDLAFFRTNGYLAGKRLLDETQVEALRTELEILMKPGFENDSRFYEYNRNESGDESKTVFHALGAWRVSPVFHDLVFFKPLAFAFSTLLGGRTRFWHDQIFVKPARDGGIVAWHQDYSYWTRTRPVAHLTCWIALDDSTIENGCVHYVPGSHRWPLLPRGELASDMDAVLDVLDDGQKAQFRPVPIELEAGQISFHHSMMLHGSYENRSERPRRAAVVNVFRDGVLSDSDESLLAGIPPIPRGKKVDGRFFPLIFDGDGARCGPKTERIN